jgi:isopenicillin N synthase-like dioxygenase
MVHHTDFSTITLLANVVGGLQVLAPGKDASDLEDWFWLRPRPGCLIVNLGDAMVQWTGGLLRSNCHCINYASGDQRNVDRYSLVIPARPERNASMKRIGGDEHRRCSWSLEPTWTQSYLTYMDGVTSWSRYVYKRYRRVACESMS